MSRLLLLPLLRVALIVVVACDPPPAEGEGEGGEGEGEGEGVPADWSCNEDNYDDGVDCDCGCTAPDPDCGGGGFTDPQDVFDERAPDDACDRCVDGTRTCPPGEGEGEGEEIPVEWTCSPLGYNDGSDCECGCNAPDPDCGAGGTAIPNDDDPACDFCFDDRGVQRGCDRTPDEWTCPNINYDDGLNCDCGCGVDDPDCNGAGTPNPGEADDACVDCFDENGDITDCPLIDTYPITALPTDCRDVDRAFPFTFPNTPPCGGAVGSGDRPSTMGAFRSGYFDAARDAFFVASANAIMRIDLNGARDIISGNVNDPANGPIVVGAGPDMGGIKSIEHRHDGHIMVLSTLGFFRVDAVTGERTLARNFNGVPAQNQIRDNSNFAIGVDDNELFVVLTELNANSGFGILRFRTGAADSISHSGAAGGFSSTNRGNGIPFDLGGGMAGVEFFNGDLYVSNGLSQNIMRVAVATGNRVIITREDPDDAARVGESTDGYTHGVAFSTGDSDKLFDPANNRILTLNIEVDLTSGDRKFLSPFFRGSGEQRLGENAIGSTTGFLIHYDDATGILYDVGDRFLRANELLTGNQNLITAQ